METSGQSSSPSATAAASKDAPNDGESSDGQSGEVLDRACLIRKHIGQLSRMRPSDGTVTNRDKLAYLRACDGDVQRATERLRATLEWRKLMGISQLLSSLGKKERGMRSTLWYDYLGPDRHGRPRIGGARGSMGGCGRSVIRLASLLWHEELSCRC